MAIPYTGDGNVSYIINEPDWSSPVQVRIRWETGVVVNRDDSEQRSRRQRFPRFQMDYILSELDADAFSIRRANQITELSRLSVAPIWPFLMPTPGSVNMGTGIIIWTSNWDVDSSNSRGQAFGFKVGGYLFMQESGQADAFYGPITTIDTTGGQLRIVFPTTTVFSDGGTTVYTTAANIFPCIAGVRDSDSGVFNQDRLGFHEEFISIQEV